MSQQDKLFVPSRPVEESGNRIGVFSAYEPGTRTLKAGTKIAPPFKALPIDIVLEKDIPVTMRDGVTIYVDVLRPVGDEALPVLVAASPYGKGEGSSPAAIGVFALVGLDNGVHSGLDKFEGPDPAYWCAHGYAICNPDPRGIGQSEGDSVMADRQEGQDYHDLIEWLAAQPWCSGKVGMTGTSYLAVSQWLTAAEQPPHLAAINPEEGWSDAYRDLVLRGGMPDTAFAELLQNSSYWGLGRKEDLLSEAAQHPLFGGLWEDKAPPLERITVPAYVVASYSNTLHTAGTFRAWRGIASEEKWLRVHNGQEWPDYYDAHNTEDLRRFFDRYLKGLDNGWDQTPRVRYAVHDMQGGDRVDVASEAFPPQDVSSTKYYLDGLSRTLRMDAPEGEVPVAYDTGANPGLVSFLLDFDRETVFVGYPKVHLWVEARGADDMDLFVLVQKLDTHGTTLEQFTVPNRSARAQDATQRGGSVLRYKGSNGRLRVSARHLDAERSTPDIPYHSFDRVENLNPGEIVEVEIELFPLGMLFRPGEQLRLVISARNELGTIMPGQRDFQPQNSGQHVIHTGGTHASFLQLPLQRR